ncbi:MAG: yhdJ [Parcubacteria group bacterium]|nr:yhdJ [Parcubacteria group bacterium]
MIEIFEFRLSTCLKIARYYKLAYYYLCIISNVYISLMNEIYFSIKEAAEILGVTPLTLRNWDRSGKFKARRHPMNNYRVYSKSSLEKVIEDIETGTHRSNAEKRIKKLMIRHEA